MPCVKHLCPCQNRKYQQASLIRPWESTDWTTKPYLKGTVGLWDEKKSIVHKYGGWRQVIQIGLMLFCRACKIATVRKIVRSYFRDGFPSVKLVTGKKERKDSARKMLLALTLEKKNQERESILLTCDRWSVPFYNILA